MKTLNLGNIIAALAITLAILFFAVSLAYADDAAPSDAGTATTQETPAPSDTPADTSTQDTSTASDTSVTTTSDSTSGETTTDTTSSDTSTSSETTGSSATAQQPLVSTTSPSADQEQVNGNSTSSESGFVSPSLDTSADASSSDETATSSEDDTSSTAGGSGHSATIDSPTIKSGDAVAVANILNFLNTNFINSSGGILVSNFVNEMPTIDLRDVSLFTGMCGPVPCSGQGGIQINLLQDASIQNNIFVNALTGSNFASGAEGTSATTAIQTGNAFAGLNLINLANTNFVNANYLMVTLNAFSGANGDIIFPSLENFFKAATGNSDIAAGSSFTNDASVTNDVTAGADSGSNSTAGADTSVIATGSSGAYTNVFNQINSILPDTRVSILFRISGTWEGQMYGVPNYVSQVRSPDGSIFLFGASSTPSMSNPDLINSTSTASIGNHVQVGALSGQNSIENASTSLISTGNAFAGANIINIANQNVIGHNWILAIINIFGNFKGDISFGRPDLWVGDQVDAPGTIQNGSALKYTLSVINNGDADAHNVTLTEHPDLSHVTLGKSSLPWNDADGILTWDLGTIPAGKAVEVTYTATVKDAPQGTNIVSTTDVGGSPSDNNPSDNSDSITVHTTSIGGGSSGGSGSFTVQSSAASSGSATSTKQEFKLHVQRITDHVAASSNAPIVEESLIVTNKSDFPLTNAVLHDILHDTSGAVLHDDTWNLDTIAPHEQITLKYDIAFSESANSGKYIMTTDVESKNWPTASFANGSIDFTNTLANIPSQKLVAPIKVTSHKVAAAHAPLVSEIPASTSTPAIASPDISFIAAAASAAGDSNNYWKDIGLFALLFAGSYGVLRLLGALMRSGAAV